MFTCTHFLRVALNLIIFVSDLISKGSSLYSLLALHLKLEWAKESSALKLASILILLLAANLVLQGYWLPNLSWRYLGCCDSMVLCVITKLWYADSCVTLNQLHCLRRSLVDVDQLLLVTYLAALF